MSTVLSPEFLQHLEEIHNRNVSQPPRLKWYLTTIIALGGMNYPELVPELYPILLKTYIPEKEQWNETRKIREGLTKVCGIWGAAKVYMMCLLVMDFFTPSVSRCIVSVTKTTNLAQTGSATRQLFTATPEHLQDFTIYRYVPIWRILAPV